MKNISPIRLSRAWRSGAQSVAFAATALAVTATLFSASTADARAKPVYYEATLASPASDSIKVVKGVIWHCEGTSCRAAETAGRDDYVCAKAARKLGDITAFTAGETTFDAAAIAKCNGGA